MIRAMTPVEIRKALHRAADVCVEHGRICWSAIDVCRADACHAAANNLLDASDAYPTSDFADTPLHAAIFLDLAAEALGNL